ncbi:hypothetical protein KV205_05810 [Streptomyces sp. SKN60]|uniref:hypothetical protein n=1 Tax=Streptomyces sp. SKN60 TaxID=2855506 RepID=UPI0022454DEB|nr:hypothetical protein [Streptomyces sp. SKN60]MCX2180049.1 hypothetical protein [Streptomyces sp. SKN60]
MRRGLVHALAWSLATGAAVTLSWWGVHTVLAGTVYDPPRALPIPSGATGSDGASIGAPTSAATPSAPTATPSAGPGTGIPSQPPTTAPAAPRQPASAKPPADTSGNVKSYGTDGGRAVFDLGPSSAELVNATPESGWQMQVWKQPTWIRVTFTKDGREISVFCLWHDSAPRVEIDERAV